MSNYENIFDSRELLVFKCIFESYFSQSISGLDMSRAFFCAYLLLDHRKSQWPSNLLAALDSLFEEIDQTIWPHEEENWTREELVSGNYNTQATIEPKIRRVLSQFDDFLGSSTE